MTCPFRVEMETFSCAYFYYFWSTDDCSSLMLILYYEIKYHDFMGAIYFFTITIYVI